MKNVKIKLLALLMLINLSSCNTRKLNRQRSESSASEQSEIRMQDLKNAQFEGKRMILMTDSADELYTVSIIPADTFSFSVQHGFRGKAEKIEVSGLIRRVQSRTDSTVLHAEKQSGRTYEEQQQSKKIGDIKHPGFRKKAPAATNDNNYVGGAYCSRLLVVKTSFNTEVQVTWLKPGLVFRLILGLSLQLRPAMKLVIIDGANHGGGRGARQRPEFVAAIREFIASNRQMLLR